MASLSQDGKIVFYVDNKKKSFRVGKLNKKSAQAVLNKVESILSYRAGGEPLPEQIIQWTHSLDRWLADAMANVGLIDARDDRTLVEFFEEFIETEKDKHGADWTKNHRNTLNLFKRYFKEKLYRDITADDCSAFREWMVKEGRYKGKGQPCVGFAEATVAGHIKIAKKVSNAAVKEKIIYANPFAEVPAGDQSNSSRQFEVTADMIEKVIEMAPNAQWRLLIGLVRFGGLRTGSETRILKWSNIDFVNGVIEVPGAKAKKKNSDGTRKIRWRKIPIYPELRPLLEEAFDPEQEFCLHAIIGTDAYIYREFKKIVEKAGFDAWPRLWHNLRASRDSELSALGIPDSAVAELMGNSPDVSRKHYKFITADLFDSLKSEVGTQVGTKATEEGASGGIGKNAICVFPGFYVIPEEFANEKYTPLDSNQ